jgi:DNA (cytosine-5)-methyltransferase 1
VSTVPADPTGPATDVASPAPDGSSDVTALVRVAPGWGDTPRAVELFAGVGGFRLGLERVGWRVVWSNQWEPTTKRQHASECYVRRFGDRGHVCRDIRDVLDEADGGHLDVPVPDHELLVGGPPCQDYSVARTLNQAVGLEGRKGALWWQVHRLLSLKRPPLLFFENVDRLLKSPAQQRGRDFAVMLASLADVGYDVEWRMVNAADYGYPQRRRRILIIGRRTDAGPRDAKSVLYERGVLARALPVARVAAPPEAWASFTLTGELPDVTEKFGASLRRSPFGNAGYMSRRRVWTSDLVPAHAGTRTVLGDLLEAADDVAESYHVPASRLPEWRYLKGAKRLQRRHRATGTPYAYVEGPIPFPDAIDRPSRTILTGEGGSTPSRFKHIIRTPDGRFRRLTPRELERLNGFPDDWTDTGMSECRRAFMMGNALVVGLVERVGRELARELIRGTRTATDEAAAS